MESGSATGAQPAPRDESAAAASSADDKKRERAPVDYADSDDEMSESSDSDYATSDESDDDDAEEYELPSDSDYSGDEEVISGRAADAPVPQSTSRAKPRRAAAKDKTKAQKKQKAAAEATAADKAVLKANSRAGKRKARRLARHEKDPVKAQAYAALQARWTANLTSQTPTKFDHEWAGRPFNNLSSFSTPLAAFRTYFTAQVVSGILEHTIDYADGGFDDEPLDETELLAFFGSLILLGIVSYPSIDLTFSDALGFGRIKHIWTRARFEQIVSSLHFSRVVRKWNEPQQRWVPDEVGEKEKVKLDPLYKIRELHDQLRQLFGANFIPGKWLALDESMCKNHHHTGFQQFNPAKPIKRGIKFWVIVDAERRIVLDFEIYIGHTDCDWDDVGKTTNIVLKLTRPYFGKSHHLYFDRFYNSVELQDALAKNGIYGCGTVIATRVGLPEDCVDWAGGARGEYIVRQSGDLVCTAWQDTKVVLFLGRTADATKEVICERRSGPNVLEITQPALAADYNAHYKGVDICDQHCSLYMPEFKTRRWYTNVFLQLFSFSMVNARQLYNMRRESLNEAPLTNLQFRHALADALIGDFCARKQMGPARSSPPPVPKQTSAALAKAAGGHYMVSAPKQGRCKRCVGRADRKSSYMCQQCEIHLCIDPCFNEHRKEHEKFLYSKQ
jgi:hypothetical protein